MTVIVAFKVRGGSLMVLSGTSTASVSPTLTYLAPLTYCALALSISPPIRAPSLAPSLPLFPNYGEYRALSEASFVRLLHRGP